jgi:hypothetical protein
VARVARLLSENSIPILRGNSVTHFNKVPVEDLGDYSFVRLFKVTYFGRFSAFAFQASIYYTTRQVDFSTTVLQIHLKKVPLSLIKM